VAGSWRRSSSGPRRRQALRQRRPWLVAEDCAREHEADDGVARAETQPRPQPVRTGLPRSARSINGTVGWAVSPIASAGESCPGRFACPKVLCGSPIRVVGATEHRERPHLAHTPRIYRGCRAVAEDVLSGSLMWPVLVEGCRILSEHASQVALAQYQDVVQSPAPDTAEEPLAHAVGPRRRIGRVQDRDITTFSNALERLPEPAVVVPDGIAVAAQTAWLPGAAVRPTHWPGCGSRPVLSGNADPQIPKTGAVLARC
jgi:hypothetical protein